MPLTDEQKRERIARRIAQELRDGFELTGLFLLRHVLEPRGQGHSDARQGFINAVARHRASAAAP